ncbi:MAG: 6-phosphofructokinase [Clostridia bacterium]|jgi:6-phosphofructokinase 1|nr:6-phosphofructokinase [Clostridia bacterium]
MLIGNCIVAQSGGPTSVINASACGVIMEAFKQECIQEVYGAQNGIEGLLNQELFDLRREDIRQIELLKHTPSSALGSCRYHLPSLAEDETTYKKIFEIFEAYNIKYFFYIGGNDSMDTVHKISGYAKQIGYSLCAIGVPKTVDNDLMHTDHCPGYGSAAKYIATTISEMAEDANVYKSNIITVVEVMGRNAGWLAAAGALAVKDNEKLADLIYLPETVFDFKKFHKDVETLYKEKGKVLVIVSEGIRNAEGGYIAEQQAQQHDIFGHTQLGGVGQALGNYIMHHITKRVKVVEYGILQRCAAHCASETDISEAYMLGREGVKEAVKGNTGCMIALHRVGNKPYTCTTLLVPLEKVANFEKKIPSEWINEDGNYVTEDCIEYMKPLIAGECYPPADEGLPVYTKLEKHFIGKKL